MTKAFDTKARAFLQHNAHLFDMEYHGEPVASMAVKQISVKETRPFIATYHYSHTMPDSTKEVYIGYFNKTIAGIVVFGMGCNKNQS